MVKLREVIQRVSRIKPDHAFPDDELTELINEIEGRVQTQVMLLSPADVKRYSYSSDAEKELLVPEPHSKIYWSYLVAMLDFYNGEYDKYENGMALFNAHWAEYVCWYGNNFHPADGWAEVEGYYISAYAVAVKHGFAGTEEEWLESLKGGPGVSVELRYDPLTGTLQQKLATEDEWTELLDTTTLRGEILDQALEAAQLAAEQAEGAADRAEAAAVTVRDGEDGEDGADGVGITSIVFSRTDAQGGNVYTVTLTDGRTYEITAPKGSQGSQGSQGIQGLPGAPGQDGQNGQDGAPGQDGAAATIRVGNVETVAPGTPAEVTNVGTDTAAILNFKIPQGANGGSGGSGGTVAVYMRVSGGYIQYSADGASWNNVIAVADLKGAAGSAGQNGEDGVDGRTAQYVKIYASKAEMDADAESAGVEIEDYVIISSEDADNGKVYQKEVGGLAPTGTASGNSPLTFTSASDGEPYTSLKVFGATPVKHKQDKLWGRYVPCEYIESHGTEYIDTGVMGVSGITTEAKASFNLVSTITENHILASREPVRFFAFSQYQGRWDNCIANDVVGSSVIANQIYTVRMETNTTGWISYVDDVVNAEGNAKTGETNATLTLFGKHMSSGGVDSNAIGKVYYTKIWDSDILVRDFIPVKDVVDNVYGMWDRATEKFYGNAGTGAFTGGPELKPVEYIQSSGIQYIDTGVKGSQNTRIVVSCRPLDVSTRNHHLCGDLTSSSVAISCNILIVSNARSRFGTENQINLFPNLVPEQKYIFTISDSAYCVDDTNVWTPQSNDFETQGNMYLCFANRATAGHGFDGQIMKAEFYDGAVLIRNYVPVLVGTEYAMLDTVEWKIYRNAGTGVFTGGSDIPYAQMCADVIKVNTGDLYYEDGSIHTDGSHKLRIEDEDGNIIERDIPMLLSADSFVDMQFVDMQVDNKSEPWAVKVLDGTETFSKTAKNSYGITTFYTAIENARFIQVSTAEGRVCSHYDEQPVAAIQAQTFGFTSDEQYVYLRDTKETVEEIKAFLADQYAKGTPVIILYPLATPVTDTVIVTAVPQTAGEHILATEPEGLGLYVDGIYEGSDVPFYDYRFCIAGQKGEQGEQGIQGEKGDKGDTGDTGAAGQNGQDGQDGAPGPNQVTTATSTSFSGLLKGFGGKVAQATAGVDYAAVDHSHSDYAAASHDHDEDYAAIDHTHTGYALSIHSHTEYLASSQKGAASGLATLDSDSKLTAGQASAKIVSVTTSKTLALTDAGCLLQVNSSSACTVTIPANTSVAFPIGTEIEIMRYGSGAVTIAANSGVTIYCSSSVRTIKDQYTSAALKKIATNIWVLQGNIG